MNIKQIMESVKKVGDPWLNPRTRLFDDGTYTGGGHDLIACRDIVHDLHKLWFEKGDKGNGRRPLITFYGYAVKKDGKYLGYNPKRNKRDGLHKKQYYKRPKFPVVCGERAAQEEANGHLGEVVKVKLTMELADDGKM